MIAIAPLLRVRDGLVQHVLGRSPLALDEERLPFQRADIETNIERAGSIGQLLRIIEDRNRIGGLALNQSQLSLEVSMLRCRPLELGRLRWRALKQRNRRRDVAADELDFSDE